MDGESSSRNCIGANGGASQYIDSLHPIVEKYHDQIPDFTAIQMREILFKDPQGMLSLVF